MEIQRGSFDAAETIPNTDPEQLRIAEMRYRRLFEEARDGIVILDAATRKITDANPFMVELLGYSRDEFLGKELWELGLLQDAMASAEAFRELQANGYIRYDALPLQTKAGKQREVEFISNVYDENGHQVVQCNVRDITGRKVAEAEAAQQSTMLAAIVEFSEDAIISKDLDGIITTWNAGAQRLYGYTAQEAIGHSISFLMPTDTPDELPHLLEKNRRGEIIEHYETVRVHKDGSRIDTSLSISPLKDAEGNIVGASVIKRDITKRKRDEGILRQSEANLKEAQRIAGLGSWEFDVLQAQGLRESLPRWSDEVFRIFGYEPGQITLSYDTFFAAIHPDDRERVIAATTQAAGEGTEFSLDHRILLPDGSERIVHAQSSTVLDAAGKVVKITGTVQDITERVQAEQVLRESEAHLRFVLDVSNDGIWDWDVRSEKVSWSERIYTLLGLSPDTYEPTYENQAEMVHPDDLAGFQQAVQAHLQDGTIYHHPVRYKHSNGTYIHLLAQGRLQRDEQGNPLRMIGSLSDLTSIMQSEAEREARNREILTIWDSMSDAFFSIDNEWRFTNVNSKAVSNFEKSVEETMGKDIRDVFPSLVGSEFESEYRRAMEEQVAVDFEAFYPAASTWAEVRAYPSPIGLSVYFHDITERKESEAALIESQQRLALATESAHIGIWDWDLLSDKIVWDAQMRVLYGIREQDCDIPYKIWQDSLHPADRDKANADIAASLAGNDSHAQFRIVRPSGEVRHIEAHASVQRGSDGSALRMIGVNWDITERKAAEASLAHQAAIVESSDDAIISKTLDGIVTSWNASAAALFGYSAEEVIGRSCSVLIAADREGEDLRLIAKVIRDERVANYETVKVCKDGRHVDISLTLSPLKNEAGEVVGVSAISRDIGERKQAENALRISEERFRAFMDNTPARVFMKDGEGRYVYLNKAVEQLRGASASALLGQTVYDHLPLEIAEPLQQNDLQVFASGQPQQFEEVVTGFDGRVHHEIVAKFLLPDADGQQLLAGIAVDVTEQKQAETERDRFFTMSLDMIGIASLDGYYKRLNPAFSKTLGYSEAELLGSPFISFIHPDDHAATQEVVATLFQGIPVINFESRHHHKDGSWRWIEWKSAVVTGGGLIYTVARDITQRKAADAVLVQMRDELQVRVEERTSELRQASAETRTRARQQEAVAELGQRALSGIDMDALMNGATALVVATLDVELSAVLELLPDNTALRVRASTGYNADMSSYQVPSGAGSQVGYSLLSKSPTIVTDLRLETRFVASPLLLEHDVISGVSVIVAGYEQPFGSLSAHTVQQRLFTQDDVHFLQSMANVLAAAIARHQSETKIRALNEQLQQSNEQMSIESVERVAAMSALREATQVLEQAKQEAEQAREAADVANHAKSEFLSRMSHELRTPLNAILGFGQILDRQDLTALQKESVGYVLKGGRHLLGLINEVLDIARVEAGRDDLSIEAVALDDMVLDACALLRPLADERNIRLNQDLSALEHGHVLADNQRLKQVLLNLVANAIKYNRHGGQVLVSCHQAPGARIRIAVRDTGPGIPAEDLPKLFTPFERLSAVNSNIEGTGLGLVLSQRLIIAMGGTLEVESVPGQGSTFSIELPQVEAPAAMQAKAMHGTLEAGSKDAAGQMFSVLCIEDNLSNLRLIEVILSDRPDITLLHALQGSMGLDLARQHEPDLILLDLHLPDMSGQDVLARLQQSGVTRDIPVIIISADATSPHAQRLLDAGAKAYLTKPLDVAEFLRLLDEVLQAPEEPVSH